MKNPQKGRFNIWKFSVFFSLIFIIIAVIDYRSFSGKTKEIELYDDLSYRLNALKVSVIKLDYLLDMSVEAGFKKSSVALIKTEMKQVDGDLNDILDDPEYTGMFKDNNLISEGRKSILNDWPVVRSEIMRLDDGRSRDELMLISNEVEMNTVLVVERLGRLSNVMRESGKGLISDIKKQVLNSGIAFILLMLGSWLTLYLSAHVPVRKARSAARRLASGDLSVRFRGGGHGYFGKLAIELNAMLNALIANLSEKEEITRQLHAESSARAAQLEAIGNILRFAGSSLSKSGVFNVAVEEAVKAGADAAAIFCFEDGAPELKSSVGFEDGALKELETAAPEPLARMAVRAEAFNGLDENADKKYGRILSRHGFDVLLATPVLHNNKTTGSFFAAYRWEKAAEDVACFLDTAAAVAEFRQVI